MREKKSITSKEGGRNLGGKVDKAEERELAGGTGTWSDTEGGKRSEALRSSRKNGNSQLKEIGGWGDPPKCTRDLGGERLTEIKGRNLIWYAWQFGEGTYRAYLPMEDRVSNEGGGHTTFIPLIRNCFWMKELQGCNCTGTRAIQVPMTGSKWDPVQEVVPNTDTVTECSQNGN